MQPSFLTEPCALIVAHPGHELRVHHWLELARPVVFVLTDGSGSAARPRLASTTRVLAAAGARPGGIYGRLSDRELYRGLLEADFPLFAELAAELADACRAAGIGVVVGDAAEGFNPGHDVCRLLQNAAVERVEAATGRRLANFEFPLHTAPDEGGAGAGTVRLELDDDALERKLAAAYGYPEMAGEVESALARFGVEPFRTESLIAVRYGLDLGGRGPEPPYYETYGEERVAAGTYRQVVRFREHLAPLAAALRAQTPVGRPAG